MSDPEINHEIELISDGHGLAVIGNPTDVERFLASQGLESKDLGLHRLNAVLGAGSGIAQAGSTIAENSGRWVKLTEKSARLAKHSKLMKGSDPSVARAIATTDKGQITHILEFVKTPGSMLTNPAMLAGAAGLMAQLSMQQAMDEITDYLATIDEKVDDILRAQKDAVIAGMIGVDLVIEEAMVIRDEVGRVSDVTWSKVQAESGTIARTQAYALRQLDALAEKLESKAQVGDLAKAAQEAEAKVQEWLAVLARCFQLQDAIAVLELDRVLDAAPADLDRHRLGLRAARQNRLDLIARSTERLLSRMDAAAGTANTKVLLHPTASRTVVEARNEVATDVVDFHALLGIESARDAVEARRWRVAAAEAKDKVLETGAEGLDATKRLGGAGVGRARGLGSQVRSSLTSRFDRGRTDDADPED